MAIKWQYRVHNGVHAVQYRKYVNRNPKIAYFQKNASFRVLGVYTINYKYNK
jgi:hypothetical protein